MLSFFTEEHPKKTIYWGSLIGLTILNVINPAFVPVTFFAAILLVAANVAGYFNDEPSVGNLDCSF